MAKPTNGIIISVTAKSSAEPNQRDRRPDVEVCFVMLLFIPKLSEALKLSNPNGSKNTSRLIIVDDFLLYFISPCRCENGSHSMLPDRLETLLS
jgi:hypothetical protein